MGIMKNAPIWFGLVIFLSVATVKAEYYSDISDEEYKKLQQIASFLQKRVEEVNELGTKNFESPTEPLRNSQVPSFEYNPRGEEKTENDDSVFAVRPSDPRYFNGFQNVFGSDLADESSREDKDKTKNVEATSQGFGGGSESDEGFSMESDVRQVPLSSLTEERQADLYFAAIVIGCSTAAVIATIVIGISCYRLHKNAKAAANVDYPAYGVTGPNKDNSPSSGDGKLAQSAQMYHYQHQKQQIIAMECMKDNKDRRGSISDAESEDENEEGDYTVYECPGLAPTGEMEVKNPLFHDDRTPNNKTKSAPEVDDESQEQPK